MGKVVLITGASSGIGEGMAYVYVRKGARLALVGREENRLHLIASIATLEGCKDVITIQADVSRFEDCERFVNETVNYYGRLDHLVNNAGLAPVCMFEEQQAIDINFWGSVYATYFAITYLKRSRGRIIVVSSAASWLTVPRLGIYSVVMSTTPVMPVKETAKAIVEGACQGAYYLTVPAWINPTFLWHVFFPEVLEWCNCLLLMPGPGSTDRETASRKIVEALGT